MFLRKAKKWIQGAIKRPGALTAKAKRAGKSVSEYCASLGENADTRTKRQCALFHTLRRMSRKRKLKKMSDFTKQELWDMVQELEGSQAYLEE